MTDIMAYTGQKVAFLCTDEEDAISLLDIFKKHGYTWVGRAPLTDTKWNEYENWTCYVPDANDKSIRYGSMRACRGMQYNIVRYKSSAASISLSQDEWNNILLKAKGGC